MDISIVGFENLPAHFVVALCNVVLSGDASLVINTYEGIENSVYHVQYIPVAQFAVSKDSTTHYISECAEGRNEVVTWLQHEPPVRTRSGLWGLFVHPDEEVFSRSNMR